MKKSVAVGLSGGVDSAVTASLLKDQDFRVTGVYLDCFAEPGCGTDQDRKDALKIALKLKIPFKVLDFKKAYKEKVLEYFFSEYKKGRTPNPDIVCNREIKFGLFYNWAKKKGFGFVATGHYVKKLQTTNYKLQNNCFLVIPKDEHKDQTYFLYRLKQAQLKHLLFPLGDLTKEEVRKMAKKRGLHNFAKKDSYGICFVGDVELRKFLISRLGEKQGEVLDSQGKVVGEHSGHWFFTIGQRHGWEKAVKNKSTFSPRLYVIDKDEKKNQVVIGTKKEAERKEFFIKEVHWIDKQSIKCLVRIRHRGKLLNCRLKKQKNNRLKVILDKPAFGIAPGQSAVFYSQDKNYLVLGGGVIN